MARVLFDHGLELVGSMHAVVGLLDNRQGGSNLIDRAAAVVVAKIE